MPRKSTQIAEQLQFPMTPPTECTLGESAPYRRHIFQQDPVFLPSYVRKNGLLFTGDSLEWLKTIQDDTIDLIFADAGVIYGQTPEKARRIKEFAA